VCKYLSRLHRGAQRKSCSPGHPALSNSSWNAKIKFSAWRQSPPALVNQQNQYRKTDTQIEQRDGSVERTAGNKECHNPTCSRTDVYPHRQTDRQTERQTDRQREEAYRHSFTSNKPPPTERESSPSRSIRRLHGTECLLRGKNAATIDRRHRYRRKYIARR